MPTENEKKRRREAESNAAVGFAPIPSVIQSGSAPGKLSQLASGLETGLKKQAANVYGAAQVGGIPAAIGAGLRETIVNPVSGVLSAAGSAYNSARQGFEQTGRAIGANAGLTTPAVPQQPTRQPIAPVANPGLSQVGPAASRAPTLSALSAQPAIAPSGQPVTQFSARPGTGTVRTANAQTPFSGGGGGLSVIPGVSAQEQAERNQRAALVYEAADRIRRGRLQNRGTPAALAEVAQLDESAANQADAQGVRAQQQLRERQDLREQQQLKSQLTPGQKLITDFAAELYGSGVPPEEAEVAINQFQRRVRKELGLGGQGQAAQALQPSKADLQAVAKKRGITVEQLLAAIRGG